MDIYFNELSINNITEISYENIENIVSTYKELKGLGINTCRISSDDYQRMQQMINGVPNSKNVLDFYYAFFRQPYETKEVEQQQEQYIDHKWMYNDQECFGAAMAYILKSICFSVCLQSWNKEFFDINRDEDQIQIRNVSTEMHVKVHASFIAEKKPIELVICGLSYDEKQISLRDDHGKDVLMDFSKKLVKCEYITSIVNSLPFHPYDRKFVRKVYEDGKIELVLVWTDQKYGIVVQTTGRNYRETKEIAKRIERKYGYV